MLCHVLCIAVCCFCPFAVSCTRTAAPFALLTPSPLLLVCPPPSPSSPPLNTRRAHMHCLLSYLPAELLNADTRHLDKADVFALGMTLYELATGKPLPSNGRRYQELREGRIPMLPTFSTHFQKLLAVRSACITAHIVDGMRGGGALPWCMSSQSAAVCCFLRLDVMAPAPLTSYADCICLP